MTFAIGSTSLLFEGTCTLDLNVSNLVGTGRSLAKSVDSTRPSRGVRRCGQRLAVQVGLEPVPKVRSTAAAVSVERDVHALDGLPQQAPQPGKSRVLGPVSVPLHCLLLEQPGGTVRSRDPGRGNSRPSSGQSVQLAWAGLTPICPDRHNGIDVEAAPQPIKWVGSAKRDLNAMPEEIKDVFGHAIDLAQAGGKHQDAKVLKGFGSAGVLEVMEDLRGDTFRAVYIVKFAGWVYVLHCFQKKSKSGIKTPKEDVDLIHSRLKAAKQDFEAWLARQGTR